MERDCRAVNKPEHPRTLAAMAPSCIACGEIVTDGASACKPCVDQAFGMRRKFLEILRAATWPRNIESPTPGLFDVIADMAREGYGEIGQALRIVAGVKSNNQRNEMKTDDAKT